MTVEQIRRVDRIAIEEFGMLGLVLMENAGRGAADWLLENSAPNDAFHILCGTGNNGGDGLVIARHLHSFRRIVSVSIFGSREKMSQDCRSNEAILAQTLVPIEWINEGSQLAMPIIRQKLSKSQVIVDALLGTGAKGAPSGCMAEAIQHSNRVDSLRVAVDIPTGLDAETGIANFPTFEAHATLTFVATKKGFANPDAARYLGRVVVLPIGVPTEVLQRV